MKKFIIILCALVSLQLFAQDKSYSFSLQQAISFAIDSSYATINSRREISKVLKRKWEATAMGLPQIDANFSYQNNLSQRVSLLPAAAFDNTTSVINTVEEFFGIQATGTPIAPQGFVPIVFGTKQNLGASATLTQLIFDGSYLYALEGVKSLLSFNENLNEKTNLEVRKQVIEAYANVLVADAFITITKNNIANVEENLFEATKVYENGLIEQQAIQQLEITLLDEKTQLSNAQRSFNIAKQLLNLTLGISVDKNVVLTNTLEGLTADNISLVLLDNTLEIEKNLDYKLAENLTNQRVIELKLEQSQGMPSLNGFIDYGSTGFGNQFDFFSSNQNWYQSSAFGITLNVPVFSSGLRNARNQQAKIALDQAKTDFDQTIQRVKLDFQRAKSNYQYSLERHQNTEKNLVLARSIEHKNQVKFKEGLATSFDLRQAQSQLFRVQQQRLNAMVEIINAKAEMETVLNTSSAKDLSSPMFHL
jgi:outer membrane protein TolC